MALPICYKGSVLDCGYRMDLVFPGRLLIELKAVDKVHPIHEAQLLTYLRLSSLPLGLLMNFNVLMLRKGILRRAATIAIRRPKPAVLRAGRNYAAISREAVDAAVEVQNHLGPGLLRSAYEACLAHELTRRVLKVERNQPINLLYREQLIPSSKSIPMVVEEKLMIASHCIAEMGQIHLLVPALFCGPPA